MKFREKHVLERFGGWKVYETLEILCVSFLFFFFWRRIPPFEILFQNVCQTDSPSSIFKISRNFTCLEAYIFKIPEIRIHLVLETFILLHLNTRKSGQDRKHLSIL